MIYIPLIWFSLLLIYILRKKKRFEISALITIAYMITSFFAIIIDNKKLYWDSGMTQASLQLSTSLLYCLLISITILPFTILPTLRKESVILIRNLTLFDNIVYFYFGIYVLFIFFFGNEIIDRFTDPDIADLRILFMSEGDDLGFKKYSGITRIIARVVFLFGSSAMFLQIIYFYSIVFLKKSAKFNISILLFSTMPILLGMLTIDRSKTIFWMMSFVALAVFFWPALYPSQKKQIKSILIIFFTFFIIYLSIITVARYGEQNLGAVNSLIVYSGQSFNNFCLFYDKLDLPGISLKLVTPILNSIIESSDSISRADLYARSLDTAVFASFSGMLIREIGVWGSTAYSIIYFLIATLVFRNILKFSITKLFLVFILLYIPYFGIFGLYYSSFDIEIMTWFILIVCYFLNKKY
jgi:hypothetical protein